MRKPSRPAFGIVGTPVESTIAPDGERRTVDVTEYGLVPREQLRTDRPGPDALVDATVTAARGGDWRTVAATLARFRAGPDRYHSVCAAVAEVAAEDETWLWTWLDAAPGDADAWCVHAMAMVDLAWRLRTAAAAKDVLPGQWAGFKRVLRQAPAACERAAELAPHLATPWITLLACAQGLGYDHGTFRALWAEVIWRAPSSVAAHNRALQYWLPRWQGSAELAAGFVTETLARAAPGQLLTGVLLRHLYLERAPASAAEAAEYFQGPEVAEAIDSALDDLAAAPEGHPYRAEHRHLLAYLLTKAGRPAEAMREFQAVDGYAGAWLWQFHADPAATFAATRAEALLGWQRAAGRR
jgi:hypothetical protein